MDNVHTDNVNLSSTCEENKDTNNEITMIHWNNHDFTTFIHEWCWLKDHYEFNNTTQKSFFIDETHFWRAIIVVEGFVDEY